MGCIYFHYKNIEYMIIRYIDINKVFIVETMFTVTIYCTFYYHKNICPKISERKESNTRVKNAVELTFVGKYRSKPSSNLSHFTQINQRQHP